LPVPADEGGRSAPPTNRRLFSFLFTAFISSVPLSTCNCIISVRAAVLLLPVRSFNDVACVARLRWQKKRKINKKRKVYKARIVVVW
jgi:hypothetical protein